MAAFSTFLRFLKWKMDGKWEMENAFARKYAAGSPNAHTDGELALFIRERSDVPIPTDQTKVTRRGDSN
jgi:hypothetical protein